MSEDRELTRGEHAILVRLLREDIFPGANDLARQIEGVRVVGGLLTF